MNTDEMDLQHIRALCVSRIKYCDAELKYAIVKMNQGKTKKYTWMMHYYKAKRSAYLEVLEYCKEPNEQ